MLCGLGWVLEAKAGQAVTLGYCGLKPQSLSGRWQVMGGGEGDSTISSLLCCLPQSSDIHLLKSLSARPGMDTIYINKIPFWPVCISASAKSCSEVESDKIWLSRERAKEL